MADEMTPERARALLEAATPGPWQNRGRFIARFPNGGMGSTLPGNVIANAAEVGDAALLAAAPDLARAYLAACEERDRLRARVQQLEARQAYGCEAYAPRDALRGKP